MHIIALYSHPFVKREIGDSSQILTTAPIFLQCNYHALDCNARENNHIIGPGTDRPVDLTTLLPDPPPQQTEMFLEFQLFSRANMTILVIDNFQKFILVAHRDKVARYINVCLHLLS